MMRRFEKNRGNRLEYKQFVEVFTGLHLFPLRSEGARKGKHPFQTSQHGVGRYVLVTSKLSGVK